MTKPIPTEASVNADHTTKTKLKAYCGDDILVRSKNVGGGYTVPTYKVILIGDSNVGKTCLAFRTSIGKFPLRSVATIGVDFVELKIKVEGDIVKLQLWDSAGAERFRYSLVPQYYRNIHAVVFVYDVTQRSSFESLNKWLNELHMNVSLPSDIPQIIIGNKCDMHADRDVRTREAKAFANSYGLPLWETSAKSDMELDTIKTIFQSLAETLRLQTPLLEFPPHRSQLIQAGHLKGLRVNQSLSGSSGSKSSGSNTSVNNRMKKDTNPCCV